LYRSCRIGAEREWPGYILGMMRLLKIGIFVICLMFSGSGYSQLITEDIDTFWIAFDGLRSCKTKDDSVRCIDKTLFQNASAGFREFIRKYNYTPEDYFSAINLYPNFFKEIRKNTLIAKTISPEYLSFIDQIKQYYPDYIPLKVCFVISPLQCGGTQTENFIFVGTEIITSTKNIDLSEFKENLLGRILAFDTLVKERLVYIIAHETIHQLQKNADFDNYDLLNKSLIEGSADFIASLLTGRTANHILYDYGIAHEQDLWEKFITDVNAGANTDNWMYNYDRVGNEMPADLGYFIGYRIAEAFYKNSTDKKQAVFDIIEMSNPKDFLKKSKYNGNL
jgi:hypothetical protein